MSKTREELLREIAVESLRSTSEGLILFQAFADQSGMNLTDLQCINILLTTGPISAGRLAEMMGLTTGAITGLVKRLEQVGYVRREKDPGDARRVLIRPVPEELERAGVGSFGSEGEMLDELLTDYDDRELGLILDLFQKSNALTREKIARIRAASRGDTGGGFAAPLGKAKSGHLVFANGAYRITLGADSGTDDLYRAHFEESAPKVKVEDGTVNFRYPRRFFGMFDWSNPSGEVILNAGVPWEIEIRGGVYQVEGDLTALELKSVQLKGGVIDLDLTLPKPAGVVPVHLSGGANKVRIRRPARVAMQLTMKDGAVNLNFDEQSFELVGGKFQLQSLDWEHATDRYEIEVTGGASELVIE